MEILAVNRKCGLQSDVVFIEKQFLSAEMIDGRPRVRYTKADRIGCFLAKHFMALVLICIIYMTFVKLSLMGYAYWCGTLTDDLIQLPFECL